jgi:hypothetical protein
MTPEEIPAEPADGTMLLGIDPTPGYEGVFVGVWHRRDSGAWVKDEEHHWFSSYCGRTPTQAYTWAEAVARGARADRPVEEVANFRARLEEEARHQVVQDAAERVVRKAYAEAARNRNLGKTPDDLHIAYEIEMRKLRVELDKAEMWNRRRQELFKLLHNVYLTWCVTNREDPPPALAAAGYDAIIDKHDSAKMEQACLAVDARETDIGEYLRSKP